MESDLSASVSQESVKPSISDRSCNHCSRFCTPNKPKTCDKTTVNKVFLPGGKYCFCCCFCGGVCIICYKT